MELKESMIELLFQHLPSDLQLIQSNKKLNVIKTCSTHILLSLNLNSFLYVVAVLVDVVQTLPLLLILITNSFIPQSRTLARDSTLERKSHLML